MRIKLCGRHRVLSWRRLFLLVLNAAATTLTLLTGLRENPVVVFVSARYDAIRARLREGGISYDVVLDDAVKVSELTNLKDIGTSYRFFSAPNRSPDNLGEDRSTCVRVNSMNATVMTLNYADFWGTGPRRTQLFLYSISAPKCSVLNFKPQWVTQCLADHQGDPTQCHRFILDQFETLQLDRAIQTGIERDFGEPGAAFLKCRGRPDRAFEYETDLIVHQSYWAGGAFHAEFQTSDCRAVPLVRNADWQYGLFRVEPVNYDATVVVALPPSGWFAMLVTVAYGVVSIAMIVQGVLATFLQTRAVAYTPYALRYAKDTPRWARYLVPFMPLAALFSEHENASVVFKGALLMGSDLWMNHWLYIWLSVLDGIVNLRMSYIILEMGTWMLSKQVNLENFLFLCAALTKLTWVMCLVHSLVRLGVKFIARCLYKIHLITSARRHAVDWYVDASALFLSYKVYNLLLCLLFFLLLLGNGTTTMMKHDEPYKRGVFGGNPRIAGFWGNEIICDLVVLLSILGVCGCGIGVAMLFTAYHRIANNNVIRFLQARYVLVGWDAILACQLLGIDPYNSSANDSGSMVLTQTSIGTLLQLLYASGPSGFVHLAGDYLFTDAGFGSEPVKFRYSIKRAMHIGLVRSSREGSLVTMSKDTTTTTALPSRVVRAGSKSQTVQPALANDRKVFSLFDKTLHLVLDDTGRLLIVDKRAPGSFAKNPDTGIRDYVVQDALSTMSILDIKPLLGNEKKLKFD